MENTLSQITLKGLEYLAVIDAGGYFGWPIDFELMNASQSEIEVTLGHWFGSNRWKNDGDYFIQFGQDGTGSLFCFWYYDGLIGEPPVVFLGSEGASCLVAKDSTDFIKQITSGKLFFDGDWSESDEDDKESIDWAKLKELAQKLVGSFNESPEDLMKQASEKHPNFQLWVQSKLEY